MISTAGLPNPSESGFIAFGAAIGAFLGRTIAHLLRYDADKSMQTTMNGSYWGTGVALAAYLAINAIEAGLR